MAEAYIEHAVVIGFIITWIGFFICFIRLTFHRFHFREWLEFLSESYEDRYRRAYDFWVCEMPKVRKSRLWRLGQLMLATGSTILILTFIFWLSLRIIEKQG
jgi:hypothetical protein